MIIATAIIINFITSVMVVVKKIIKTFVHNIAAAAIVVKIIKTIITMKHQIVLIAEC